MFPLPLSSSSFFFFFLAAFSFNLMGLFILFCMLPVDHKGGNAHMISSSSAHSRAAHSSSALGPGCKHKKPLSAAKACISEILPSKFKPRLSAPSALLQDRKSILLSSEKAQSCENLCVSGSLNDSRRGLPLPVGGSVENLLMRSRRDYDGHSSSTLSLQEFGAAARRPCPLSRKAGPQFTVLYRDMHHINRAGLFLGSGPSSSVRDLASHFERSGLALARGELGPSQEGSEHIPKHTVSSRITAFEQLIQRSRSMPSLDLSGRLSKSPTPVLARSGLVSARSAESLLESTKLRPREVDGLSSGSVIYASPTCSRMADSALGFRGLVPSEPLSACSDELDRCSNVSSDSREGSSGSVHGDFPKHRLTKCKGTCPASYTRFTTIRRHEQQQASRRPDWRPDPRGDKGTLLRNIYLMSPLPFRLKKPLQHPLRQPGPGDFSGQKPEPPSQPHRDEAPSAGRPSVPKRLSSRLTMARLSRISEPPQESPATPEVCPRAFSNGNSVPYSDQGLDGNNNPRGELGAPLGGGLPCVCPVSPHPSLHPACRVPLPGALPARFLVRPLFSVCFAWQLIMARSGCSSLKTDSPMSFRLTTKLLFRKKNWPFSSSEKFVDLNS